jgi:hypothetical protein
MIDNLDSVSGMIHVHKDILNCPELNAIALVDSQIRAYIRKNTFPTDFGNGVYILPIQMFEEVDSTLTELKKDRDVLIEKFKDMYDQRKLEAETRLGRFYEEKDYPSIEKLNACFDFRIQYLSFDVPKNLKNIRSEIYERELEKVDKMWLRTLEIIKTSLYSDFGKLLEHLKERLAPDSNGKAKKFKEATLLNLIDFTQTFDKKNIICDPKLAKIVNDLRLQIINLDSKSLRDNEKIRIVHPKYVIINYDMFIREYTFEKITNSNMSVKDIVLVTSNKK